MYAHREDTNEHEAILSWVSDVVNGERAYGITDIVLSGFIRIFTHPRVFDAPSNFDDALAFANQIRQQPSCIRVSPGVRHWTIFERLCRSGGIKGNLVPEAFLAALAIESGGEWIITDGDFARFLGLKWRHPLRE